MKKLMLTTVLISLLISCSEETIVGSGNLVTEEREVASFSRISNEGIIELDVSQGDSEFLEITADDNIIDRVRTRVVNGELLLYLDGDSFRDIRIRAVVTTARLSGIRNSGTGDVTARNLAGASNFTLYNSGTANVTLEGNATSLTLENEGSGDVSAFNFLVEKADISLLGSGNCEVHCTDSMKVFIEGSGDLYYWGNPSIEAVIEGSGKVINSN
jgi:hypothetical protein